MELIDPIFDTVTAEKMLALRDSFGPYGMYSNEGYDTVYAPELPQRADAMYNHIRKHPEASAGEVHGRTNYFRETYAYGDTISLPGIEPLLNHEAFKDAARTIHGREVIEPAIVFANIYLPGQELAIHTDVGEFRGANRTITPQWLVVAMSHSGLFEQWRIRIATAISFFGAGETGALICYPDGKDGRRIEIAPKHNTAVVIDADKMFHGVGLVAGDKSATLASRSGMKAHPGKQWVLKRGEEEIAVLDPNEIRYSVSWKAYCFEDDLDKQRWAQHEEDLGLDFVLNTIETDLRDSGVLVGPRPDPNTFGLMIIDEYIRFPDL